MKKKLNLTRRSVLRGAGSIAIALPWLEIMAPTKAYSQEYNLAKRFLTVYTPGGTVRDKWASSGSEFSFNFGPILQPLNSLKSRILIPHGLDMRSAIGEQHQAGIIAFLTGTPQDAGRNGYSGGPSLDQVIANRIGGDTQIKSLQIAIRWATGKSHGLLHPINALLTCIPAPGNSPLVSINTLFSWVRYKPTGSKCSNTKPTGSIFS